MSTPITSIVFYVISLKGYEERQQHLKTILSKNHVPYKIVLYEKHTNPTLGAILSHLKLYVYARKNNLPYIAILEDNITIYDNLSSSSFKEVENFISTDKKWNQLYLGGAVDPWNNRLQQIPGYNGKIYNDFDNLHGTNAYIVSSKCYNRVLNDKALFSNIKKYYSHKKTPIAFDMYMRKIDHKYVHKPFIFSRRTVKSIINGHLDLARKFYFTPPMTSLCQWCFFKEINIGYVMAGGIVLVLALTVIALYRMLVPNKYAN